MNYTEQKVWDYLQQDEQVVLSLLHAQEVSLASVSQLLGKRTYQIRKLNYQAIKMYRLFFEFFEEDPAKDIEFIGASPLIREMLLELMDGKTTATEEKGRLAKKYNTTMSLISSEYEEYLNNLEKKDTVLLNLLREIDRYRKRFLPTALQWPSPYRRKRNRAYKNLAAKLWQYDTYILHFTHRKNVNRKFYIPAAFTDQATARVVYLTNAFEKTITENLGLPYYEYKDDAMHLAKIIRDYYSAKKRTPQMGSLFMKDLRLTLEKAENYKKLFRIPQDIKIDKAFLENSGAIKQQRRTGAKRASENLFN